MNEWDDPSSQNTLSILSIILSNPITSSWRGEVFIKLFLNKKVDLQTKRIFKYRVELSLKKCKTAILLYCFHTMKVYLDSLDLI